MRRLLLVLLLVSSATALVEGVVPCEVVDASPECFVALRPGPTENALDLVQIPGEETSESSGELLLTTVLVQGDLGLGDLWELRGDPSSRRVDRSLYFPDDVDENVTRDQFAAQMEESTQSAAVAALRHLGFDLDPTGVRVEAIVPDGPADGVVEPAEVVVGLEGGAVTDFDSLLSGLDRFSPGDAVTLEVETPGGDVEQRTVTLGENPDDPARPFLGLFLVTRIDVPIDVEVDAGRIGGPSAGLMFALSIVDKLTDEDLTGGLVVAGTGSIGLDGRVSPIGGIRQKIPGSQQRDDGGPPADVFLVPRDNFEAARGAAVQRPITLVPIDTLDDAVAALVVLRTGGTPDGAVELAPAATAAPSS